MPANTDGLKTTLSATANQLLADVQHELIFTYDSPDLIFPELAARRISTDAGGKYVTFVSRGFMNAQKLAEGATPDYQHDEKEEVEVSIDTYAVRTGVTWEMVEDSRLDEIAVNSLAARRAMDEQINQLVVDAIKTGWYDGSLSDAPPDYGSNTFTTSHDHIKEVASANTALAAEDLAEGQQLVNEHGFRADTVIIHSAELKDLQASADFAATGVGSQTREDLLRTGAVGQIYGMNVIVSDWVDSGSFAVFDSRVKPVLLAERVPIEIREGDAGFGITDSYFRWRGGASVALGGAGAYLSLA